MIALAGIDAATTAHALKRKAPERTELFERRASGEIIASDTM
ncbi:hypothetical protein [Lysobacter sp. Root690]|nr:hypothetical protein [Lysobacter sp. Root690]